MDTYRSPQASQMLLSFIATGQSYPQDGVFSLLGTHKVGDTELRAMQRGSILQGVENDGDNIIGVLRFAPKVRAYRIRPFLVATGDPSGEGIGLNLGIYPKFHGDRLQGNSQGVVQSPVADEARTAGTVGKFSLNPNADPIDIYTENPFTGNDWLDDFVDLGADDDSVSAGEALGIYPVGTISQDYGAFGRTLSLEGFSTDNTDSGFILIDPAFNEYLIARITDINNTSVIRGVIFVVESDT